MRFLCVAATSSPVGVEPPLTSRIGMPLLRSSSAVSDSSRPSSSAAARRSRVGFPASVALLNVNIPPRSSPGISDTRFANSSISSRCTPALAYPVSSSMRTSARWPWAAAASDRADAPSMLSTPHMMRICLDSARKRSIFSRPITGYATKMSSIPPAAMTSASLSFAQHTPFAPNSICIFARRTILWVLVCGRSAHPCRSAHC